MKKEILLNFVSFFTCEFSTLKIPIFQKGTDTKVRYPKSGKAILLLLPASSSKTFTTSNSSKGLLNHYIDIF